MFRSSLIQQSKIADMSVIIHLIKMCWLKIKEEMPCEIVTWICESFVQRNAIRNALVDLIEEKGFEAITVKDITIKQK